MLAALLSGPVSADLVDDLARPAAVIEAKISPLGDYLAVLQEQEAQRVVAVFEFPGMQLVNLVDFPGAGEVADYWWVNDERLLFTVALDWGNRADDLGYGQLYAVDARGKQGKYLDVLGGAASNKGGDAKAATEYVSATLAAEIWSDPEHVLINTRGFSNAETGVGATAKINIYTGSQTAPGSLHDAQLLRSDTAPADIAADLQQMFGDADLLVVSESRDKNLAILRLIQDTRTPEFYLLDRDAAQLRLLFDAMPWVNDDQLAAMQPVTMTARDGARLSGYLSIPKGVEGGRLPLIVVPHGAPVSWGFGEPNFVPAAGYAMLQLNPRRAPSDVAGADTKPEFEEGSSGDEAAAAGGQDDVGDAVRWAIVQGVADSRRICIFGWGAGGYAVLTAVMRDPQMYKCAVAGAGVYREAEALLAAGSPLAEADKLVTPLLLVHGDDDQLAPVEHVYALQQAVKQATNPEPELLLLKDAPHRVRREDNVRQWYRRTIDFFAQHIGPGVMPPAGRTLLIAEPPIP